MLHYRFGGRVVVLECRTTERGALTGQPVPDKEPESREEPMKKPLKTRRTKIGSTRFDLAIDVQFLGLTVEGMEVHGTGIVRNLSMRGALIDTDALVEKNDHLTLFLTLPNQADVIESPAVAVRWVIRRHQLGVEFLRIDRATSRRLMRFLSGVHNARRARRSVADHIR
jgi:hypothetical protein